MTVKKAAIARVPPKAIVRAPGDRGVAAADHNLVQTLVPLKQFESLLKIATGGGKAAGWGLVGSGISVGIGLSVHTAFLASFGTVGLLLGLGIYATRFLHLYKTTDMEELDEKLHDIEVLFARGRISKDQFDLAYQKILKKAGVIG